MIISRGYDAMKIRDIADKLNISTGLFFNYFESKEKANEELVKIGLSGPENVLKLISNLNVIDPVLPVIIKGQHLGEIREGDPEALALAYWGAIQGIAETYALYPNLPLPNSSWIVDVLRA